MALTVGDLIEQLSGIDPETVVGIGVDGRYAEAQEVEEMAAFRIQQTSPNGFLLVITS